jgi:hypothetical protein
MDGVVSDSVGLAPALYRTSCSRLIHRVVMRRPNLSCTLVGYHAIIPCLRALTKLRCTAQPLHDTPHLRLLCIEGIFEEK